MPADVSADLRASHPWRQRPLPVDRPSSTRRCRRYDTRSRPMAGRRWRGCRTSVDSRATGHLLSQHAAWCVRLRCRSRRGGRAQLTTFVHHSRPQSSTDATHAHALGLVALLLRVWRRQLGIDVSGISLRALRPRDCQSCSPDRRPCVASTATSRVGPVCDSFTAPIRSPRGCRPDSCASLCPNSSLQPAWPGSSAQSPARAHPPKHSSSAPHPGPSVD